MHDPLCEYRPDIFTDWMDVDKGKPCTCDLIAKVRADERDSLFFDIGADKYHAWYDAFEQGYKMGKTVGGEK